jgi:DNA-directed RNA polymerase subunit M
MKFCEKCSTMMLPKKEGKKTVFSCNSCGFVSNKKEKIVLSEKTGDGKKFLVEVVDKKANILPKIDEECPKCAHSKSFFWLVQTRAGDEAETRFFKCVKCNHTWREY